MELRSRKAPQFAEIFKYNATRQEVHEDLETMYRSLQRLKRRRLNRGNPEQTALEADESQETDDRASGPGFRNGERAREEGVSTSR